MNRFSGPSDFRHGDSDLLGVLLVNLGTPSAPEPRALRRYLKEFLSDPRVVEFPRWAWWLILNVVILNIRPKRSARAYEKIWTSQGSPLMVFSRRLQGTLSDCLTEAMPSPVKTALGMRYGHPSVAEALDQLLDSGVRRLLVLPLYPQYSGSTTGSVFDAVADYLKHRRRLPALRFIDSYHDHPKYVEALTNSITDHWQTHGRAQHLLMSFHGVPQRYLTAGDPYHCLCHKSARLVASALGLGAEDWTVVFQSRFGREPWLQPYCDQVLGELPGRGIHSVDVVCPGFAVDCLETLEEIDLQYRELFLAAGGSEFRYIPCLNDSQGHVAALEAIVNDNLQGWPGVDTFDGDADENARDASRRRALAMGASR